MYCGKKATTRCQKFARPRELFFLQRVAEILCADCLIPQRVVFFSPKHCRKTLSGCGPVASERVTYLYSSAKS